jgi:hypothetical protein
VLSALIIIIIINAAFCTYGFRMILNVNMDYSLTSINQVIFVIEKRRVLFEVRTELLNITFKCASALRG